MLRILLLLVMAISQAQPLAAALLCEQHHAAMHGSCMGDPAGEHNMASATHDAATTHDCAAMLTCSAVTSAILTPVAGGTIASTEFRVEHVATTVTPVTTLRAPPFHPPRA